MLNILIPMAGRGGRFSKAGYQMPKPLVPVHGMPMIRLVIENVRPSTPARFIFICQTAHVTQYDLRSNLQAWAPGCVLIDLDGLTEGAACTILAAADYIDNDEPLMIVNSDQFVDTSIDAFLEEMKNRQLEGLIMTMTAHDSKWSFAKIDETGFVTQVEEKKAISSHATTGVYSFRRGRQFVSAARSMMAKNLRVNNEFYIAPVYNELVAKGERIGIYPIGSLDDGMYGLGTPEDLQTFLAKDISKHATRMAR